MNQFNAAVPVSVEVISHCSKPSGPVEQRSRGAILGAVFTVSEAEEVAPYCSPVRNEPDCCGCGGEDGCAS